MADITIKSDTNFDKLQKDLIKKTLVAWGFLLEAKIKDLIEDIPLWKTGDYWRGVHSYVDDNNILHLESDVKYAPYLEFGTYDYFEISGLDNFPKGIVAKKKSIIGKGSTKKKSVMPKGTQPFAPFRRILYDEAIMRTTLKKAITIATKNL